MAKNKKDKNSSDKRFQSHFRKFHDKKTTGHPQYVYDEDGRVYKVIGITSSPKTNGVDNILLECNPEPNNKETAYIRPKPDVMDKGIDNKRLIGWRFSANDKKKVREVIDSSDKKKPRKK